MTSRSRRPASAAPTPGPTPAPTRGPTHGAEVRRGPRTKAARLAEERLRRYLRAADDEAISDWDVRHEAPDAWRTIELDLDTREKKVRVTLRLDASVAAYFRAMGPGYQARINRILGTYAQMKILELLEVDRAILERRLAQVDAVERAARAPVEREAGERGSGEAGEM